MDCDELHLSPNEKTHFYVSIKCVNLIYIFLFYLQCLDASLSLTTMVNHPLNKDNEDIIVQKELMIGFPNIGLDTFTFY